MKNPLEPHTRRWLLGHGSALVALTTLGCTRDKTETETPTGRDTVGSGDTSPSIDTSPPPFDPCAAEAGSEAEGWTAISLSDQPDLVEIGGWVVVSLQGKSILVAQAEEDCFIALSALCTHEGCVVEFRTSRLVCPCHGAVFSQDGSVQGGPTSIPLQSYPAARNGDHVWVQMG